MKHSFRILAVLFALLLTATACSTAMPPEPSPSPIVSPLATVMPTDMPSPIVSVSPLATNEPAAQARKVGENIALYVGNTKVDGEAYYDARNVMVFPLEAVAEALDWEVDTADGTPSVMTLTKGDETVTVSFVRPAIGQNEATEVSAKKGNETLTIDTTLPYIGGTLYVPEAFLDSAFGEVDIEFNNTDRITITPKA